jgi:hypothetical protein
MNGLNLKGIADRVARLSASKVAAEQAEYRRLREKLTELLADRSIHGANLKQVTAALRARSGDYGADLSRATSRPPRMLAMATLRQTPTDGGRVGFVRVGDSSDRCKLARINKFNRLVAGFEVSVEELVFVRSTILRLAPTTETTVNGRTLRVRSTPAHGVRFSRVDNARQSIGFSFDEAQRLVALASKAIEILVREATEKETTVAPRKALAARAN